MSLTKPLKSVVAAVAVIITILGVSSTAQAAQQGVLETPNGRYEFTPRSCGVHVEDGVYDIELNGPGVAPDGEKIYFEYTSTGNAISVELGVDQPFKSSDRQIRAGQFITEKLNLEVNDNKIEITDIVLMDENNAIMNGKGALVVDCNR